MRAALGLCPRVTGSQDKAGRHGHNGLLRMPERPVLKVFYFPEDRGKHLRTRLWLATLWTAHNKAYLCGMVHSGQSRSRATQDKGREDRGKRCHKASPHWIQPVSPHFCPTPPGFRASCLLLPLQEPPSSFPRSEH